MGRVRQRGSDACDVKQGRTAHELDRYVGRGQAAARAGGPVIADPRSLGGAALLDHEPRGPVADDRLDAHILGAKLAHDPVAESVGTDPTDPDRARAEAAERDGHIALRPADRQAKLRHGRQGARPSGLEEGHRLAQGDNGAGRDRPGAGAVPGHAVIRPSASAVPRVIAA